MLSHGADGARCAATSMAPTRRMRGHKWRTSFLKMRKVLFIGLVSDGGGLGWKTLPYRRGSERSCGREVGWRGWQAEAPAPQRMEVLRGRCGTDAFVCQSDGPPDYFPASWRALAEQQQIEQSWRYSRALPRSRLAFARVTKIVRKGIAFTAMSRNSGNSRRASAAVRS